MSNKGDILQRGSYKAYTSKDRVMRSWVLYPSRWKAPDGFSAEISSPTPNCGHENKKQMEKCSSAMYICFISWVITTLMYEIVIR